MNQEVIHCKQTVLAQPSTELPEILLLHSEQESKILGVESDKYILESKTTFRVSSEKWLVH